MVWLNNLGFADPYGTTSRAVDALFTQGKRDLGNGFLVVRVGDDALPDATIDCLTRGECGTTPPRPTRCSTGSTRHVPRARCTDRHGTALRTPAGLVSLVDGVLSLFRACAQRPLCPGGRRRARKVLAAADGHGPAGNDPVRQDVRRRDGRLVPEGRDGDGDRGARQRREGAAQPRARHVAAAAHGAADDTSFFACSVAAAPECQGRGVLGAARNFLGQTRGRWTALLLTRRRREHATPTTCPQGRPPGGDRLRRRQLQPPAASSDLQRPLSRMAEREARSQPARADIATPDGTCRGRRPKRPKRHAGGNPCGTADAPTSAAAAHQMPSRSRRRQAHSAKHRSARSLASAAHPLNANRDVPCRKKWLTRGSRLSSTRAAASWATAAGCARTGCTRPRARRSDGRGGPRPRGDEAVLVPHGSKRAVDEPVLLGMLVDGHERAQARGGGGARAPGRARRRRQDGDRVRQRA